MANETATPAEEEYLESLFWLFEAGLPMTGANLSRAMQLSAPTVHEMLGRLERDGYIVRDADRTIDFTSEGREHAERIVSLHRMNQGVAGYSTGRALPFLRLWSITDFTFRSASCAMRPCCSPRRPCFSPSSPCCSPSFP